MKKRLLSSALALIMALALLPMSVFAANGAEPYLFDVQFGVSNGVAPSQVSASYQVRDAQADSKGTYIYGAASSTNPITSYVLSQDTSITISKLRLKNNGTPADLVVFYAWSDSDNDGVYDQRMFSTRGSEFAVVPLTEKGPFVSTSNVTYTDFQTPLLLGFKANSTSTAYSVTLAGDQLYDLFGPNTLLAISVLETVNYTSEVTLTVLLSGESASTEKPTFTDVSAGAWYADPVAWAVEKGITNGTKPGQFSPNQNCTQAQILTFLYRAARTGGTASADDMDKAVRWAREKGMIDSTFDGSKPCTRSTAVSYIWQAFNKPTAKASSFTDVPANAAYAKAVNWAVEKGVTKGTSSSTFSPGKTCNRGEIVTFLYRAYNN